MDQVCGNCGSLRIVLDAGYYFCQECGSQQQGRRETELEYSAAAGRKGERIAKPAKKEREEQQKRERVKKLREDPFVCERALPPHDYPRWLEDIGTRLCTATKVVVKCAYTMTSPPFKVPKKCVEHSKLLFYTYLQKAGIAFCPEEITDDPAKAFCPTIKRNVEEIAKLKSDRRKAAKKRNERMKQERLNESSVWEQIQDESQVAGTSHDRTAEEIVQDENVNVMERIKTSLSIDAVNRASTIYLGIDLLLGIVYLATQMCGCQWIQLVDIFRWYREGHFHISYSQLLALCFSTSLTEEHQVIGSRTEMKARQRRFFKRQVFTIGGANTDGAYFAIQPTSESLRVLSFLTQFIGIPASLTTMDFNKVLARLVYNLNLPRAFLQHLFTITAILPPVNLDIGSENFRQIQPIDPGLCNRLAWICARKYRGDIGFVSFFQRCFMVSHRQIEWTGTVRYRDIRPTDTNFHFVPIPVEVKAAAVVLFALKLFFGLDGKREFKMKPKIDWNQQGQQKQMRRNIRRELADEEEYDIEMEEDEEEQEEDEQSVRDDYFDFGQWLRQLELRTHCWQGTPAKNVLTKDFHSDQLERSNPEIHQNASTRYHNHVTTKMFSHHRLVNFTGCIPNTVLNPSQPNLFEQLFPNHFMPSYTQFMEDYVRYGETNSTKEALFTPLQYQSSKNSAVRDANNDRLDPKSVKTFFKRFYDTKIDLELPAGDEIPLNMEEPGNGPNKLTKLFPCGKAYKRFPPPLVKCFAILLPEFDDHGMVSPIYRNRKHTMLPYNLTSMPITPILSHKQMKMAFAVSEHYMSHSFRYLLRHLSLAITELDHLVFFAFLMVESMFFDKNCFDRFERELREYGSVKFTSQATTRTGNLFNARYKIKLDSEDMEKTRQQAKLHEFRYKVTRTRLRGQNIIQQNYADDDDHVNTFIRDYRQQNIHFIEQQENQQEGTPAPIAGMPVAGPFIFANQQQPQPQQQQPRSSSDESDQEEEEEAQVPVTVVSSSSSTTTTLSSDTVISDLEVQPVGIPSTEKRPIRLFDLPAPATFTMCAFRYW